MKGNAIFKSKAGLHIFPAIHKTLKSFHLGFFK